MKDKLAQQIHKRIVYINNKLEGCLGYSPDEKRARIEELQEVLKLLENLDEHKRNTTI